MNFQFESINNVLSGFECHGLADLDRANLQDRVDSKFVLPIELLEVVLQHCQSHYSVLEIEGKRTSEYFNQYFDTAEMQFYRDHHNGKLNRYKVRQRTYVDTDTRFLEVKFKNNQKRTIKSRVRCEQDSKASDGCHEFIQNSLGQSFNDLQVAQIGGYRRIALANEASAERLTLDFNLWYQASKEADRIDLPGFFIAELKQAKRSKLSPFYQLMTAHNMTPTSFSKYCIGCALTAAEPIKYNRFKPTLMKLHSLTGHSYFHTARNFKYD